MKAVTKRELNQQTAQVLAAVTPLEPLLVTEHGIARWRIEVVDAPVDPVARLRDQQRITPAKAKPQDWGDQSSGQYTPAQVDVLFADSRGDY